MLSTIKWIIAIFILIAGIILFVVLMGDFFFGTGDILAFVEQDVQKFIQVLLAFFNQVAAFFQGLVSG